MVSAMEYATIGVSSLPRTLQLFQQTMGLQVDALYDASKSLLEFWDIPAASSARIAELSCRGYGCGRLRLLEVTPASSGFVRVDHGPTAVDSALDVGPKALDFYVRPPIERVVERLAALGYVTRSEPVYHQIGTTISEEVLFTGPDELPLLFMIGHAHAPTSMRAGSPDGEFSEIPTVSIITGDLDRSRAFYADALGLQAVTDAETPPQYQDLVDDLTGAPRGTRVHFLLYAQPGEPSGKILLLHFFERTGKRLIGRMRPRNLGFVLSGHRCDDLDALASNLRSAEFEIVVAPREVERGSHIERMMLVQGPNEELLEFRESRCR
ncbi:MAG TPA: VOC family protein [Steroidobacteraceae bacterium]|nr:VOC family protein [Steroidobacteraceae bacterium]